MLAYLCVWLPIDPLKHMNPECIVAANCCQFVLVFLLSR